MNKQAEKGLVPKLRFPEFRGVGAWTNIPLNQLGQTINGLAGKAGPDFGSGKPYVTYKQVFKSAYINFDECGLVNIEEDESQNELKKGDILFTTSSETPDEVGYASVLLDPPSEPTYLNSFCFCFRPDDLRLLLPSFSRYLFHSIVYRNSVTKLAQGSTRYNISKGAFLNLSLPIPENKFEKQKIADCLSSLDDLITAENEKLEALKAHKKGLMQQLFPAEDETVPRLRFKRFEGEWEIYDFYDLLEEVLDFRGRTPIKLGMQWGEGDIISLSANNVKNGYIDYKAECNLGSEDLYEKWMGKVNLEKGDIVFTMEAPLGNALQLPDSQKYILSQRVVAFKTNKKIINSFLIQLIWSNRFQSDIKSLSTGSTAKGINQKALSGVKVNIPKNKEEQQKIADCLSSLDEFITAQGETVQNLTLHKKGLMLQLFPNTTDTAYEA